MLIVFGQNGMTKRKKGNAEKRGTSQPGKRRKLPMAYPGPPLCTRKL